ncbi:DciA family protein [Neisseria perflava]|uniref:DciA family protein n=1 Tax=Neisseria perflava TaxID=33053 RepID=UPI003F5916D7|nr:hypothetical protein [Neisseria perflava]
MEFDHLRRGGLGEAAEMPGRLQNLLQISRYWQKLDREVKKILPANLRSHVQTACIDEGVLVLLAANNMAASRLKMLLPSLTPPLCALQDGIESVRVKLIPKTPPPPKANKLVLSDTALDNLERTVAQLEARHPELAHSLAALVGKHRR